MRRVTGLVLSVLMVLSLAGVIACGNGQDKGDPLVGTWEMMDNPSKTVSITKEITKEGEQYIYTGSQGPAPANKVDDNTLSVPMGPIEVTVQLDPASGVLTVMFMGETYSYKKSVTQ